MNNTITPEGHYAERGITSEEAVWRYLLANERTGNISNFMMGADISHGAFRLYVLLESLVDFFRPSPFVIGPSRKQLANHLRVSTATLDRYLKELVAIKALVVEKRMAEDGGHMTNAYGVCYPFDEEQEEL